MEENWIKNLKVGDEVVVARYGGFSDSRSIAKVEKIGKATVRVNGTLYNLDGRERGSDYHYSKILECSDELRAQIKEENLRRRLCYGLSKVDWNKIPTDKLITIYKIVKED